jgi:hypothetical protein
LFRILRKISLARLNGWDNFFDDDELQLSTLNIFDLQFMPRIPLDFYGPAIAMKKPDPWPWGHLKIM